MKTHQDEAEGFVVGRHLFLIPPAAPSLIRDFNFYAIEEFLVSNQFYSAGLFLALFVFSTPSISQEDTVETTVVTATRSPTPISEVLSVSTVLTREDIDLYQASDVIDLLAREAGVSFVRNGGRGSATSLALRGNQGDHTLFLVDGVRIGSATLGSASLASLNMDLIERVEIIRGPKSALYGADAIGGVINLITRTSARDGDNLAFSTEVAFGSNSTNEVSVLGAKQSGNYSFTGVLSRLDTEGIDNTSDTSGVHGDDDGYENISLGLNYGQTINEALDFRVSYNRNDSITEYDAGCTNSTTFAPVDCLIYTESLVDTLAGSVNYQINNIYRTSLKLGLSNDESEELADNVDLSSTYNGGVFETSKQEATWLNFIELSGNHLVTAGLDYFIEEVEGTTAYDVNSRDNHAGFVQLESSLGIASINLGLRHDDNEQFGSHTTPSIQAGFQIGDAIRIVASYAEGFKAPTFNDLYFPGFGNPTYVPEESKNTEISIQHNSERTSFYASLYQNDIENLIQYNAEARETDQLAKAEIIGFEFDIDVFLANWQLGIAGNIIDPENKTNGNVLRRRAKQGLSADVDTQLGAFSYGLSVRAESDRYDDVANTVRLGGYGILDLRSEYQFSDEWQIKVRVDNLLDKQYVTATSFSLGEYRSTGREAMVTFAYTPQL